MADSENSRTLSAITCRNPLQSAEWCLSKHFSDQEQCVPGLRDSVLTKWHVWHCAFREITDLGRALQKLESQLRPIPPPPEVEIPSTDSVAPFVNPLIREIQDRSRELGHAGAQTGATGYKRAKQAEEQASIVEEHLADELLQAPAVTTVEVAAKLYCLLARDSPRPDSDESPWPQIRLVLIDVMAMNGVP